MLKIVFVVLSVIYIIAASPTVDKRDDFDGIDEALNEILGSVRTYKRSILKRDDADEFGEDRSVRIEEDSELEVKKRSPPNCEKECGYKFRPYCGFASECEYNCEKKHDPNVRCAKPANA